MSRRATQLTLVLSLIVSPAVLFARAPQVTQASAAAAEANAQAASAQASALQAASQQATTQVTAAQTAFREAMQNYTKAPAGAAKTAAQAAVQQAQKQLVAAQTAARTAATQAMAAHSAAAQAAAQAAAAQAALARQAAAAPAAQPPVTPTAASVSHASAGTASTAGSGGKGSGAASGGNSTLSTVLGSVFGNGTSTAGATGASGSKSTKNGTANAANNSGGNANQTTMTQGNALVASSNGGGRGGAQPGNSGTEQQNAPAGPTRKVGAAFASGALGVGQSTDTLLTVYGCSRMGTQVMCDTDLSNQNNSVNQVSSADQWKDVYLQDDAGDNHMRSMGVFENQNGDQRTSITLPYGEKSRYILVFNGVPANVKSVTLKSSKDTLDVEGIPVASPDAPEAQGTAPSQAAPAGIQPASAPAGRTGSRPPHS